MTATSREYILVQPVSEKMDDHMVEEDDEDEEEMDWGKQTRYFFVKLMNSRKLKAHCCIDKNDCERRLLAPQKASLFY